MTWGRPGPDQSGPGWPCIVMSSPDKKELLDEWYIGNALRIQGARYARRVTNMSRAWYNMMGSFLHDLPRSGIAEN
jgi:hypothetical protein